MADITALILADHNWFREQFAKLDALQAESPEDRTGPGAGMASARREARRPCLHRRRDLLPPIAQAGRRRPGGRDARCDRRPQRHSRRSACRQRGRGRHRRVVGVGRGHPGGQRRSHGRGGAGRSVGLPPPCPTRASRSAGAPIQRIHDRASHHQGLPIRDRDPKRYVEKFENKPSSKPTDDSLGIGSLKGK